MISATEKYICDVDASWRTSSPTRQEMREVLRIAELVGRHEHRPHRAERVERLAAHPLSVAELEVAGGDVVDARVAEDVVERVGFGDVPGRPADHDPELGFVVHLAGQPRIPADVGADGRSRCSATWRTPAAPRAARPPPRPRARGSCGRSPRPCPVVAPGRAARSRKATRPAPATRRRNSSPTPRSRGR